MIYCPYLDLTRDIRSNIPLCLQEFPWALPSGTPSGKGVYLTVYPESRPNTDTICCNKHFAPNFGRDNDSHLQFLGLL